MFFPIRDDNPTVRTPFVTVALIVINVLVFLYTFLQGKEFMLMFTYQFGFIPIEFTKGVELTPQADASAYLTPFTSMFMHGGWMHLIGNMLFLWIFGNNIEDYFGHIKFIIFYVLAGLAAVALYTVFSPSSDIPLVGASGAIAGVMGAYMVLHPKARITVLMVLFFIQFFELPAFAVLGFWFLYQLLMSLIGSTGGGGVAWLAHVGGFAFGWILLKLLISLGWRGTPTGGQRVYKMSWN